MVSGQHISILKGASAAAAANHSARERTLSHVGSARSILLHDRLDVFRKCILSLVDFSSTAGVTLYVRDELSIILSYLHARQSVNATKVHKAERQHTSTAAVSTYLYIDTVRVTSMVGSDKRSRAISNKLGKTYTLSYTNGIQVSWSYAHQTSDISYDRISPLLA